MIKPSIEIRGISAYQFAHLKMQEITTINMRQGMELCAKLILDESQRLVPVEFGPLKASGVVQVEGTGLNATVVVQYGGETAPYAWIVHQNPLAFHAPPTQSHYVSDAVANTKEACQAIMNRKFHDLHVQGGVNENIRGATGSETRIT